MNVYRLLRGPFIIIGLLDQAKLNCLETLATKLQTTFLFSQNVPSEVSLSGFPQNLAQSATRMNALRSLSPGY